MYYTPLRGDLTQDYITMAREAGAHESPALGRERSDGLITTTSVLGMTRRIVECTHMWQGRARQGKTFALAPRTEHRGDDERQRRILMLARRCTRPPWKRLSLRSCQERAPTAAAKAIAPGPSRRGDAARARVRGGKPSR